MALTEDEETRFLNVDVDVWARADLAPLVVAMGKKVLVHHVGREGRAHSAHFSLAGFHQSRADTRIRRLVWLVKRLPTDARRLWDRARVRDFNIGVQAGRSPYSHEVIVEAETLALVAEVGGRIVVTTYAPSVASSGNASDISSASRSTHS